MKFANLRLYKILMWLALSFILIGTIAFFVIRDTVNYFVENQAVAVAEMVVTLSKSARSVYSQEVVEKLQKEGTGSIEDYPHYSGYVPLPAQFLKFLGRASTHVTDELFQYKPVSKWNLEPTQDLNDDFLQWAWPKLESQDLTQPQAPIAWKPIWRIEQHGDKRVMRYLAADAASSQSCADCHNRYETTAEILARRQASGVAPGKQFKLHQLLGALSVTVPLDRIEVLAEQQIRRAVLWIMAILAASLAVILAALGWSERQRRKVSHLSWQANHDALTELANRRGFERSLLRFCSSAREENKTHSLAMLDLDGFKAINDTYGHHAGDEILKLVARTIKAQLRTSDVVARLGGDEFAVLLHGCPVERGREIADNIRNAIQEAKLECEGKQVGVGVSIGVALIRGKAANPKAIIEAADAACYVAKKMGKNSVFVSEA